MPVPYKTGVKDKADTGGNYAAGEHTELEQSEAALLKNN